MKPGNDIMIGQPGENDYDAEGGDDIMAANAAIDRFAGAAGFDWAIHQYDTVGADDDMNINANLAGRPLPIVVNRDRWQETEANSGSAFNDLIKGDNFVPSLQGGAAGIAGGFTGCDALDQAGVDRITGLAAILPPLAGNAATDVGHVPSVTCLLSGPFWGAGNILIGGPGSDTIEGRGANDIIDGDRYLRVKISVRTNPADPATETGATDLMENKATSGDFGTETAGMTLQQAVFGGLVDPGNLVSVREILTPPVLPADCGTVAPFAATATSVNCDTAVFSGPRSNYSIVSTPALGTQLAKLTVTQTGANVVGQKFNDGTDTLRNIEALKFSNQTVLVTVPGAPTIGVATATASATATVTWTAPAANGGPPITSFTIVATPTTTGPVVTRTGLARTATSGTIGGLVNGTTYTIQVGAVNLVGTGPLSAPSNTVTPVGLPGAPTAVVATRGNASAALSWTAPASNGGSPITGYKVQVRAGATVLRTDLLASTATNAVIGPLVNGTSNNFRVQAVTALGSGPVSAASNSVTPATVPDAPVLGVVTSGAPGVPLTVTINWTPPALPATNGGAAISGYTVSAYAGGIVVQRFDVGSAVRTRVLTFSTVGPFTFDVTATNAIGSGAFSARSAAVLAQ